MGASKLSKKLEILNDNLKIIITPDQNMLSKIGKALRMWAVEIMCKTFSQNCFYLLQNLKERMLTKSFWFRVSIMVFQIRVILCSPVTVDTKKSFKISRGFS